MTKEQWLAFAAPRPVLPGAGEGARHRRGHHLGLRARQDAGRLLPGARRHRLRHRQVAGGGPLRRHPLDGDQDRRPARRQEVRRRHPRRLPGQDAGLQPLALVQLGHHRDERRADAGLPGGARQDGLRLQLHHLRRPPDRRPGLGGVRRVAARGRHAGPGPAAAEVPPARVGLPHAADAGGRPARRRRPDGHLRPHLDHQGHGAGLDPAPAPGPDRGAAQAPRGVDRRSGGSSTASPRSSRCP